MDFEVTYTFLTLSHKWSNLAYILRLPKRVSCDNRISENISPSNYEKRVCGKRPRFRNITVFFTAMSFRLRVHSFPLFPSSIFVHCATQRALGNEYLRRASLRPGVPARKPPLYRIHGVLLRRSNSLRIKLQIYNTAVPCRACTSRSPWMRTGQSAASPACAMFRARELNSYAFKEAYGHWLLRLLSQSPISDLGNYALPL